MTEEMTTLITTGKKNKPILQMNKKKMWQILIGIIIGIGFGLAFLLGGSK
jgi:hypothetical protein